MSDLPPLQRLSHDLRQHAASARHARIDTGIRWLDLVEHTAALIHAAQRERGASQLVLHRTQKTSTSPTDPLPDLATARTATDLAIDAWTDQAQGLANQPDPVTDPPCLYHLAQCVDHLAALPALRAGVSADTLDRAAAFEAYSGWIETLLALVYEAAGVSAQPAITQQWVALFTLMYVKEQAGQERAWTTAAFAEGGTANRQRVRLAAFIDAQEDAQQTFTTLAGSAALEAWHRHVTPSASATFERLRRIAASALPPASAPPPGATSLAGQWFALSSARIDALREVETTLLAAVRDALVGLQCDEQHDGKLCATTGAVHPGATGLREVPQRPRVYVFTDAAPGPQPQALPDPVSSPFGRDVLALLQQRTVALQHSEVALAELRQTLEHTRLTERAKARLMHWYDWDEAQAHRELRRLAMNQGRRLTDAAQLILALPARPDSS